MFKTMLFYRITNSAHIALLNDWAQLNEALGNNAEHEPAASQWRALGFAPFNDKVSEELVWSGSEGVNLFSMMIHERALTAATIREEVLKRGAKVEAREGRKVYRNEYAQIKDEVIAELLPRAFIKHRRINAMVIGDLLVVGASTAKLAEDFLCVLREAMDGLSVRPLSTIMTPAEWLTRLMKEGKLEGLKIGDSVKLVNSVKDTISFKGIDLSEDEPQGYLETGFAPKELEVLMGNDLLCKVTDTLIFKGLKFSETLLTSAHADADGDQAAIIDADIIMTTDIIKRLIHNVADVAGEDRPDIVTPQEQTSGLRMTHINDVPLEDLMSPAEKLANLQEQFATTDVDDDEDF